MYGLFAPVHKVTKVGSAGATPSPQSRSLTASGLRAARERSGSQESVSSISSTASSVSRSRVRLGVTSLANQVHGISIDLFSPPRCASCILFSAVILVLLSPLASEVRFLFLGLTSVVILAHQDSCCHGFQLFLLHAHPPYHSSLPGFPHRTEGIFLNYPGGMSGSGNICQLDLKGYVFIL